MQQEAKTNLAMCWHLSSLFIAKTCSNNRFKSSGELFGSAMVYVIKSRFSYKRKTRIYGCKYTKTLQKTYTNIFSKNDVLVSSEIPYRLKTSLNETSYKIRLSQVICSDYLQNVRLIEHFLISLTKELSTKIREKF